MTRSLNEGEMPLKMASSASISIIAVGELTLSFSNNSVLVLHDCLFVPNSRKNLISVSKLCNDSYSFSFNKTYVSIIKENEVVTCGTLVNNLYHIDCVVIQVDNVKKSLKRKEPSINQTQLWHLRLGHINLKRIQRLVSCETLATLTLEQLPLCQNCIQGKMTKRSFTAKGVRARGCLDLIHSYVCGPFSVHARGGCEYFITFTDDYSRYGYVYLMKKKSEALDKFKEFKAESKKQLGRHIKSLRSYRGGEYMSIEFVSFLEHGILSQFSAPGTPQQNGVTERRKQTLLDMVRSMMSVSTLPLSFWGYALETAAYILTVVTSKSVPKTPMEMWTDRKLILSHIRIWGCPTYVLKRSSGKLDAKSELCWFVGYLKGTRGYNFYNKSNMKVFVSTNAKFMEEEYIMNHIIRDMNAWTKKIEFPSIQDNVVHVDPQPLIPDTDTPNMSRRSGRVIRLPVKLTLMGESHEDDPTSYYEAINNKDFGFWKEAIKSEFESMYSNNVWTLVDSPQGVKPIGCKWVYRWKG